ncbi:uncharacterized protein LOC109852921 [Pseudomyrmex gracilis]|uniref:uncharacterized protein LOC109852921 n=1 Tax=Pseudomyrmex gracilis TaxID=219809 RepID=UPI000995227E|nr:uncharacterized protein LOC109852921 [Pseudomyrmex gracilis]
MRSLYVVIALLSIFGLRLATDVDDKNACNCDESCDEERVIGLEEETTTHVMYKEDDDGDGNRTICARNRDFNDRTFPSVCHMFCYNHCTRYRILTVEMNDTKYVVAAYRPNYYKLKDGEC